MTDSESDLSDAQRSLKGTLERFFTRTAHLHVGFPIAQSMSAMAFVLHEKEKDEYALANGEIEEGKQKVYHTIPIEHVNRYELLRRRSNASAAYYRRMPGFHLSALVEELDLFLGEMIEQVLISGKADQKITEKSIEYIDLLKFNSFQEAKDWLVSKETDKFLRKGIGEQVEWLNSIGAKLPMDHNIILQAIECVERRNCVVHSDSKASKSYLDNLSGRGVELDEAKIGKDLRPSNDYLKETFSTFIVFGCMVFTVIWSKMCRRDDKKWEHLFTALNDIVFKLMLQHDYATALRVACFMHDDLKDFEITDTDRRVMKVNLALCEARAGTKKKAEKILDSEDWRSTSHNFQAAVAAVRGQTDEALAFIRTGFAGQQISKADLIQWPVFEHLRTLKKFKGLYEDLIGTGEADKALVEAEVPKPYGSKLSKVIGDAIALLSIADKSKPENAQALAKPAKVDPGESSLSSKGRGVSTSTPRKRRGAGKTKSE